MPQLKKNDQTTALLQRMDQHQKQIETQLAELKAETKQLEEEKGTAIREKRDYTINQERLAENIWRDLEKEYADRVQDYLKQLQDEMRAKIESKMTVIRDQYKNELNQEIEKLKAEWAQESPKTNEQHNAQISQVLKEVEALKEQSHSQPKAKSNEPGDKISGLKATAFNFMPGTVNTQRGGAVNIHDDTFLFQFNHANRTKNTSISQVHCAIQYNLTSSILMMKIPLLVIQTICSSVILAIHLCSNQFAVKSQHKPW